MIPTGFISATSRFGSLPAFLLLLFSAALAQESQGNDALVQYPATIEFDVVFPRNDTYAPAAIFPIIFAVQNYKDAVAFHPSLSWHLGKMGSSDGWLDDVYDDVMQPYQALANITGDPRYYVYWTDKLNGTKAEGQYSLLWAFVTLNCSSTRDWSGPLSWTETNTLFTIKEGAKAPDLVAKPGVCPTQGVTLRASEEFHMEPSAKFPGLSRCARVTDEQPPTDPCRANMNEAVASNISAMLAAEAFDLFCYRGTNTTVCPSKSLGYRLIPDFWPAIASLTTLFMLSAS